MRIKQFITALIVVTACTQAYADAGDWLFRIGGSNVDPKSDNNDIVEVDDGTMLTFNATYFYTDNWAVELLAALPFEHDISLDGGPRVGETKHLPPTISAQYHFTPNAAVRPYVGLGLNYTIFFEEDTRGALAGTDLELDPSLGLAAQVGVDFDLTERWFLNAEVRYIDIESDATVKVPGGPDIDVGDVEIDPWLFGVNLGLRF